MIRESEVISAIQTHPLPWLLAVVTVLILLAAMNTPPDDDLYA